MRDIKNARYKKCEIQNVRYKMRDNWLLQYSGERYSRHDSGILPASSGCVNEVMNCTFLFHKLLSQRCLWS